ncbi:MAG: acyl-CoA thioesterase [Gemmatimonadetes bacterium]|nr:acyl-CoA thioesterase [Gemmatimonadota bacterium]MBK9549116.1 acyl-CoA thioesterase [Gemmatimonadota bacterium]
MQPTVATDGAGITTIRRRVDYSETDQMGVVYHARYLVWFDVARTEHLRQTGLSYRDLETLGFRLMVGELTIRYRRAARYDDPVRVRTWVRERASRRVTFGYAVEHDETGELLATGSTAMLVMDDTFAFGRLPEGIAERLQPIPDPVRL